MFETRRSPGPTVRIDFDGAPLDVAPGQSVAAALLTAGVGATRRTPDSGASRGPYCMIGVCFDCLVVIDGQANRQACMVMVRDGMRVESQAGAPDIAP